LKIKVSPQFENTAKPMSVLATLTVLSSETNDHKPDTNKVALAVSCLGREALINTVQFFSIT
jgi:hypothetical protein